MIINGQKLLSVTKGPISGGVPLNVLVPLSNKERTQIAQ